MIVSRKIFQDVCNQRTNWDSPFTLKFNERWDIFRYYAKKWPKIEIARSCLTSEEPKEVSLHIFSDTIKVAYCVVAYIEINFLKESKKGFTNSKDEKTSIEKDNVNLSFRTNSN